MAEILKLDRNGNPLSENWYKPYYFDQGGNIVLDWHPGQQEAWDCDKRYIFVFAGTQGGKELPLDTPIPTPDGFVPIGDLEVGDVVYNESGSPCNVTWISSIHYNPKAYKITFDDDCEIVTCADHQWLVQTKKQRTNLCAWKKRRRLGEKEKPSNRKPFYSILTTQEMIGGIKFGKYRNYSIWINDPIQYPERELPLDPYFLGVWLGDGCKRDPVITSSEVEIIDELRVRGFEFSGPHHHGGEGSKVSRYCALSYRGRRVATILRELGVRNNKHIPDVYMIASVEQRTELLQGLFDTDGTSGEGGQQAFSQKDFGLAYQVVELMRSLGIKTTTGTARSVWEGIDNGEMCVIRTNTSFPLFRLKRKLRNQKKKYGLRASRRFIRAIEPIDSVPMCCISVDNPKGLYLCTHDYITTHNTSFSPWWLNREIERTAQPGGNNDYLAISASNRLFNHAFLPAMIETFCHVLDIGHWWGGTELIEIRCLDPNDPRFGEFYAGRPGRSKEPMWGRIILCSAESKGGLESATARAVVMDECGQDSYTVQDWEAIQRRIAVHKGRVLGMTTLYNLAWVYEDVYQRFVDGDPEIAVIQFPSHWNPVFDKSEYDAAKRKLPDWRFAMFYDGKFKMPSGTIYKDFNEATMLFDLWDGERGLEIEPDWEHIVGVDFGGANTAILWMAQNPADERWYAYHMTLEGNLSTQEHVYRANDFADDQDIKEFTAVGGAKGETQQRTDWDLAGFPVEEPPVSDLEAGIDRVTALIKEDKLRVARHLEELRREFKNYRRKLDDRGNATEQIVFKRRFHGCDALRYAASYITEDVGVEVMTYSTFIEQREKQHA